MVDLRRTLLESFSTYDTLARRLRGLPCTKGSAQEKVQVGVGIRAGSWLAKEMGAVEVRTCTGRPFLRVTLTVSMSPVDLCASRKVSLVRRRSTPKTLLLRPPLHLRQQARPRMALPSALSTPPARTWRCRSNPFLSRCVPTSSSLSKITADSVRHSPFRRKLNSSRSSRRPSRAESLMTLRVCSSVSRRSARRSRGSLLERFSRHARQGRGGEKFDGFSMFITIFIVYGGIKKEKRRGTSKERIASEKSTPETEKTYGNVSYNVVGWPGRTKCCFGFGRQTSRDGKYGEKGRAVGVGGCVLGRHAAVGREELGVACRSSKIQ